MATNNSLYEDVEKDKYDVLQAKCDQASGILGHVYIGLQWAGLDEETDCHEV